MKRNFIERVHSLNIKYAGVTSVADEGNLDIEIVELKSEIAVAAFNGDITAKDAKGLFSLLVF